MSDRVATSSSGSAGVDLLAAIAAESDEELAARVEEDFREMTVRQGRFLARLGELDRRGKSRDDGATSMEAWTAQHFGVSTATARNYVRLGEKAPDLPHLVGSLCAGDISLDKVRAVADVATPGTERRLLDQATEHSVRDLLDIARSSAVPGWGSSRSGPSSASQHARRFVRFNDEHRTMTAQLPAESYAEVKAGLDATVRQVPSDGETPLDQRRCDAFLDVFRSSLPGSHDRTATASPYLVVVHVPLDALLEDDTDDENALVAELERDGLIDGPTVRRISCDATLAVAVDDDVGHTMYEGRAKRFPSDAQRREVMRRDRHCRFPGCSNVAFTNVHHIVPWKPGGRTDLDNLVLLCLHHHGMVHRKGWAMTGNANAELTITGPTGQVMTSRPSPLWTRVTAKTWAGSGR